MDLKELKKYGVDGKTGFSIKSDDTPENNDIHTRFKTFCKVETANDYTAGLSWLLDKLETSFTISDLQRRIEYLENKIEMMEQPTVKEESPSTF